MGNALDIYNKYKDKYDKPKQDKTVLSKSNTVLPAKRPVAPAQRIVTTPAPNTPPAPVVSDTGNPFTALPLQFMAGFIPKTEKPAPPVSHDAYINNLVTRIYNQEPLQYNELKDLKNEVLKNPKLASKKKDVLPMINESLRKINTSFQYTPEVIPPISELVNNPKNTPVNSVLNPIISERLSPLTNAVKPRTNNTSVVTKLLDTADKTAGQVYKGREGSLINPKIAQKILPVSKQIEQQSSNLGAIHNEMQANGNAIPLFTKKTVVVAGKEYPVNAKAYKESFKVTPKEASAQRLVDTGMNDLGIGFNATVVSPFTDAIEGATYLLPDKQGKAFREFISPVTDYINTAKENAPISATVGNLGTMVIGAGLASKAFRAIPFVANLAKTAQGEKIVNLIENGLVGGGFTAGQTFVEERKNGKSIEEARGIALEKAIQSFAVNAVGGYMQKTVPASVMDRVVNGLEQGAIATVDGLGQGMDLQSASSMGALMATLGMAHGEPSQTGKPVKIETEAEITNGLPAPREMLGLPAPENADVNMKALPEPQPEGLGFVREPVKVVRNTENGQTGDVIRETKTGYVVRWHKPSLGETSVNKKFLEVLPNEIPINTPVNPVPPIAEGVIAGRAVPDRPFVPFAVGDRVFNETKGYGTIIDGEKVVWDNGFDARGELVGDTPLVKAGEVIPQSEVNNIVKQSEVTQPKTKPAIDNESLPEKNQFSEMSDHELNMEIRSLYFKDYLTEADNAYMAKMVAERERRKSNPVQPEAPAIVPESTVSISNVGEIPNLENAGNDIQGLEVTNNIKNKSSIDSSLTDYTEIDGIKKIPLTMFEDNGEPVFYSKSEKERTLKLAEEIKNNKKIDPLIVVYDNEGFYILEGGHRFDALKLLGIKDIPAKVIIDQGATAPSIVPESPVRNEMPASEEIPVEPTEPWQMTRQEFELEARRNGLTDDGVKLSSTFNTHYRNVINAVIDGKPVPEKVLNEYPDIQKDIDITKQQIAEGEQSVINRQKELQDIQDAKELEQQTRVNNAEIEKQNQLKRIEEAKSKRYLKTKSEYVGNYKGNDKKLLEYEHRQAVEQALADGKSVPPEVLADYPDLSAKQVAPVPAPEVAKDVKALNQPWKTKENVPQVAQITKMQSGIEITIERNDYKGNFLRNETLKGDRYLIPGYEEHPIILVKPSGNRAKGTKSGFETYDEHTGALIYSGQSAGKLETAESVLNMTSKKIRQRGKVEYEKLKTDWLNKRQVNTQPAELSKPAEVAPEPVTPRTKPVETTKPVEVKPAETGQGETFGGISEADASDALNRVKQKFNNMGIVYKDPIDAETLKNLYTYGKYQISKGFNTFETWSKKMIQEAGETVKPHLESLWARINDNINQGDAVTAKEENQQRDYDESLENIKSWRNKQNPSISSVANTGIRKALNVVRNVANRITEEISNSLQSVDTDIIKPIGKKVVFADKATNNPIIMLNNQRKTTGIVSHIVKAGGALVTKAGKRIDVSLTDLFKEINNMVGKNREAFDLYLEHRLNVERHDQDVILTVPKDALSTISRKPSIDVRGDERTTARYKGQSAVIINQNVDGTYNIKLDKNYKPVKKQWTRDASVNAVTAYEKSNPEFVKAAERLYGWQDKFMQEWAVGDIMTKELYDKMRAMYQSYVPARRVEDVELTPEGIQQPVNNNNTSSAGNFDKNTLGAKNPLKRATGGVSELQDFEKQIGENISRYVNATKKNEAFKTLLYWAKQQPDKLKFTMEVVPEKLKLPNKTMDELLDYIEDKNKGIGLSGVPGKYIVRIFQNGEITTLRINDNLYRALNDNTYLESVGKVTDWVTEPVKYTITGGNIIFTTRNVPMDFQTYMVNTIETNPVKAIATYNTALKEMVMNSERWQQYQSLGNIHSTLNYQANRGWVGKGVESNKAFQALGNFQQGAESIARFAEWINTVEKNGGNYDNYDALQLANFNAANITTDFSRHGRTMQSLDKAGFLYANAAVQGVARNFKQVVDKPVESALKLLAYQIVPTMVLAAFNGGNKNYNDLPDRDKDAYFMLPNLLGEKDKNGNATTFTKIPKVRGYRIIGNLLERAYRLTREIPEKAFNGYMTNALAEIGISDTSLNPLNNNIFATWLKIGNLQNNRTEVDWKKTPYLPKTLQDVIPEEQYNMQTGELAKEIAKVAKDLHVSPIQLEAFVKATIGGLYQVGTPITDYAIKSIKAKQLLPVSKDNFDIMRPWTADPTYNSELSNKFFTDINTVLATTRDAENKMEYDTKYKMTKEVKSMVERRDAAADYLSEVLSMIKDVREIEKEIEYSKRQIPSEAQRKDLKSLKKEINNMQREYLDNYYYKRKK